MQSGVPSGQPRPKKKLSTILLLIALIVFIIGIPGYILSARNYADHYSFIAENGKTLKITAARGETVTIAIQVSGTIAGYWATDGIQLTLNGVNTPLTIVAPKERTWGSTISTKLSATDETATVSGNFTVPSSIGGPEQRTISGTLSGTISYPSGGFMFSTKTYDVNVPVQLQLEPQSSTFWSGGRIFFTASAGLEILCGILLALLAVWALLRTLFGKHTAPDSRDGSQIFKDWLWGLGGGIFSGGVCSGLLAALLLGAGTGGFSAPPDDINEIGLLICGIIALTVFLAVLKTMITDDKKPATTKPQVPAGVR
ncbi:hypothetical protein KSF_037180 [Reticulibacter mediterranei]|uniref:Uncharacterized protein n=1 Tax=Reticulibacter mediterranei TaxID=2778369 RepID=A0A8J3N2Z0_9CHLR|nr:hypothetical protein [Reticulibacter mediterranei]GHO93670.1 hypothetical protein KSF_037180 [Reticulibacter mediterranei]